MMTQRALADGLLIADGSGAPVAMIDHDPLAGGDDEISGAEIGRAHAGQHDLVARETHQGADMMAVLGKSETEICAVPVMSASVGGALVVNWIFSRAGSKSLIVFVLRLPSISTKLPTPAVAREHL